MPVWDGNETWLVFGASALYAAFPMAYAIAILLPIPRYVKIILAGAAIITDFINLYALFLSCF